MQPESPFVTVVDVVKVDQRERSTVHSSDFGGGGLVYKGTGFTIPVNVHTTHESWLEVWVRFSDGMEDRLNFNSNMLVREGHTLAMLMCRGQIWAIKNFSTGITTTYIRAQDLVEPLKQPLWRMLIPMLVFPVTLVAGAMVGALIGAIFALNNVFLGVWTGMSFVAGLVGSRLLVDRVERETKAKWSLKLAKQQRFISESLALLDDPDVDQRGMRSASEKPERLKQRANTGND
jgi:hypothetical protein